MNGIASWLYQIAEILNLPLEFLTCNILGRLKTVLVPGKYGNSPNLTTEAVTRFFLSLLIAPMIPVTLICSVLWEVFNLLGDLALGSQSYIMLPGKYSGPGLNQFAQWNMASLMQPRTFVDGVEGGTDRLKEIASHLRGYHFVTGQEMDGAAARLFSSLLADEYAEFYSYIGKSNFPCLPSGLFFASKEKVLSVTVTPFTGKNVEFAIKRTLAVFELKDYYVATMHLDSGDGATVEQTHLEEVQQALAVFAKLKKPIIWCGDFNEDRYIDPTNVYKLISSNFPDAIGKSSSKVITCTDQLKKDRFGDKTPAAEQSIDYISSNTLPVTFIGKEYYFDLSDHSLIKGKIG